MMNFTKLTGLMLLSCCMSQAQSTFQVTGTPIPVNLLQQNYGRIPSGIIAYDLNICNVSGSKQSIVSSKIYQALTDSDGSLQPIGREIMLAAILRNQSHSVSTILSTVLTSVTGVLSIVGSSKFNVPAGVTAGAAIAAVSGTQLLSNLRPVFSADQVEKFENQVLELALILDSGSCVERTVFALDKTPKVKTNSLNFHVE